jgi:hypothetical protein
MIIWWYNIYASCIQKLPVGSGCHCHMTVECFLSKPSKEIQQALSTIVISNTRLNQDHSNINSQTWAKLHDFKFKVHVFFIYTVLFTPSQLTHGSNLIKHKLTSTCCMRIRSITGLQHCPAQYAATFCCTLQVKVHGGSGSMAEGSLGLYNNPERLPSREKNIKHFLGS